MREIGSQRYTPVRVANAAAYQWLWTKAPCSWVDKVDVSFREVLFEELEPASSLKHWDVLAFWTRQIACRRLIPPLIVTETECRGYYIQDGNHRYEALRICFRKQLKRLRLRVAVLEPVSGYGFSLREFGDYKTYVLGRDRQILVETRELMGSAPVAEIICEMRMEISLPQGNG